MPSESAFPPSVAAASHGGRSARRRRRAGWGVYSRKLGLALFLAAVVPGPQAAAEIEKTTVVSLRDFANSAYPCIERLSDGRLLCVFSAYSKGGKISVAGIVSSDHGRTWSKPRTLIDTPDGYFDYDPNIIVIGRRVIVTSTTCPPDHHQSISTSQTIAVRSEDDGATWSQPYEIKMGHRYTSGKINNGIVLADGSVLFGYTWEAQLDTVERIPTEGDMIERSSVMISHDQGLTWENGGDVIDDQLKNPAKKVAISGICEPAIVQLGDGSVYMLARTGVERLYESRSKDGGKTWSSPVPSPLTGHNAPAALCPFKGERNGILVVWNNSPNDRWPLCVAASYDDAKTWTKPRVIANTPGFQCSYPGCVQAADGTLVVVWQQDSKEGREILAARFQPSWLLEDEKMDSPASRPATRRAASILPGRVEFRGPLRVTIGDLRIVMRGPMFPRLSAFRSGAINLTADAAEEGGATTSVRSGDHGRHWRPFKSAFSESAGFNSVERTDGTAVALAYDTKPVAGRAGDYAIRRWESRDHGQTATELLDGILHLPPDRFDPKLPQWFHGNVIELPGGELLAAMQGRHVRGGEQPFRTFIGRSGDGGRTWHFGAMVATLDTIEDPHGLTRAGWRLHGPCEPAILALDDQRLVCVMRLVNDDESAPRARPCDTYRDLACTVSGADLYPGQLAATDFYGPGPATVPLIVSYSYDRGQTWTKSVPLSPGRGCFPRLQRLGGILALSYGALTYPRWGNALTFSADEGKTWCDELILGPYLTTGYTDIVPVADNRLLYVFDAAPPQPWKNHASHWIGAVDVEVELEPIPSDSVDRFNVSATPMPRSDPSWVQRHHAINQRAREGGIDVVFLGDSITHRWESAGRKTWDQHYGARALNAGIDGDGTQTVLWRIQNGNLDGIDPKVAVLMIGTNNSTDPRQPPADIAEGIRAIVREIRRRLPQTHILLLAVFPRGQHPTPERERGAEASRIAATIADGRRVHFLDIGSSLSEPDGTISAAVMPDYLHLSPEGYARWAEAMNPTLAALLEAED